MARKKHLINVHTSTGTTAPTGASLYLGEIAVQHTPNDPALWIKVGSAESSTVYEKFIGETEIIELIDNSEIILGSGYTYSGLPYVNSATTIADAYSALTRELIDNEIVITAALSDLNDRIVELSGNTGNETDPIFTSSPAATITQEDIDNWNSGGGGGEGAVTAVTVTGTGNAVTDATFTSKSLTLTKGNVQATISDLETIRSNAASGMAAYNNVNALSAGTIDELSKKSNTGHTHTISEVNGLQEELDGKSATGHTHSNYATTGDVNTLSSATQNIQSSAQTAYNSRITGGTITSGSTNSITTTNNTVAITAATLPSYSTANNDQVLMIKNGAPQWVTPATITYSSSAPTGGNDGDIWVQTS